MKRMPSLLHICLLALCFFGLSNATIVSLNGSGWQIHDNGSFSINGKVPATIHTNLFAAKLIPEPYFGYDDVTLRYLVYQLWTFNKSFNLTDDFLSSGKFTLHFDQVDTVANVTLNGCFLGQTNNMFLAYDFDVNRVCLRSNNELRLDFESPVTYALNQAKAYNDSTPPDCPPSDQHGECYVQFIRKEPCSFSWNWVGTKKR